MPKRKTKKARELVARARIDDGLMRKLERDAGREHCSVSFIIRRILRSFYEEQEQRAA